MTRHRQRWGTRRRLVQSLVALAFVALPFATAAGLPAVHGTLAALGLGPGEVVEPSGALSAMLAAGAASGALLLGLLPWMVAGLLLGPVFCSWICPWGLVSELLDRLRPALRFRGRRGIGRRTWPADAFLRLRRWRVGIYGGLMLLAALAAMPVASFVSPPRLMTVLPVEAVILGRVSLVTGGLLAALLAFELVAPRRLWCRVLCPVGTGFKLLTVPLGKSLALRTSWDEPTCTCPGVPACQTRCSWGVDPRRTDPLDGCTNCFACVDGCPTGALRVAFGPTRAPSLHAEGSDA